MILIIRGPAASGKSTIAQKLAKKISADYISFDKIMEEKNLDIIEGDGISAKNFIKANNLIIPFLKQNLIKNKFTILDGCFYRKEQIEHLEKEFPDKITIFTLIASLGECIKRNKERSSDMSEESIKEVFDLVNSLIIGIKIETSNKNVKEIILKIEKKLIKFY